MASVPAVPILTHAERQRLAYDLLKQFISKGLKEYSEYSSRNASLIRRANTLVLNNSNAATSLLRSIGKSANYDVSTRQKKIQQKLASSILIQKKPEKYGPPKPPEQYKVKKYKVNGIYYKTCTSLFKPFSKEQATDTEYLTDYLDNREEKTDYIVSPYSLVKLIFANESTGYDRIYVKIQGITEDYPVSDGILTAQFLGSTTSDISSGQRRTEQLFEKFELIKFLKITFRTLPKQ